MATPADVQRQFFDLLLQSQGWPAERLRDYQRAQLTPLLVHARAHVPFYARRLDPLFRRDGSIDWTRWQELPILKRADVAGNAGLLAPVTPAHYGRSGWINTSGTTGRPATIHFNELGALASIATKWRSDVWHGVDWSRTLYVRQGTDVDEAAWPAGAPGGLWGPSWDVRAQQGRSFRLNRHAKPAEQLEFMTRIGAAYAAPGAPNNAHVIAAEAVRLRKPHPMHAVFAAGEAVTAADREICRQAFGAEIIEVYSSKEGHHMAHRCPSAPVLHANAETVLLEVLDENDRPCAPGQLGRVVITPFFSATQPLIRYDHGDLAVLGEACACGRSLPTISRIVGRESHMFVHPDGRKITRYLPDEYRAVLNCSAWQFAQVGPNDYEVRYVASGPHEMTDEAAVAQVFRDHFFDDAIVHFRQLEAIPLLSSGKFIECVNEFAPQ